MSIVDTFNRANEHTYGPENEYTRNKSCLWGNNEMRHASTRKYTISYLRQLIWFYARSKRIDGPVQFMRRYGKFLELFANYSANFIEIGSVPSFQV